MRIRKCKQCAVDFHVIRAWQVFCSTKCKNDFHSVTSINHSVKYCEWCGLYGKEICHDCASILLQHNFTGRKDTIGFLIDFYVNKYDLRKSVVEWDNDELQELGAKLRWHIEKLLAVRRSAEDRVTYLRYMANRQ